MKRPVTAFNVHSPPPEQEPLPPTLTLPAGVKTPELPIENLPADNPRKPVNYHAAIMFPCVLLIVVSACLALIIQPPFTSTSRVPPSPTSAMFYCVYTPRNGSAYGVDDIPKTFCRHIIYCCVELISGTLKSDEENAAIAFSTKLKYRDGSFVRYLGIGGLGILQDQFEKDIGDVGSRTAQVKVTGNLRKLGDYNGGVALFVPTTRPIATPSALVEFLTELLKTLGRDVLVVLPYPRASAPSSIDITHLVSGNIKVAFISHEQENKPGSVFCPSPHTSSDGVSLVSAFKTIEKEKLPGGIQLSRKIAFTFSVKAFRFRNSTLPGTEVDVAAYPDVCANKGKKGWKESLDPDTGCTLSVNAANDEMYSVLNSASNKFLEEYAKDIGGAVVFDIDLDDYAGACGDKYPLLKMLYEGTRNSEGT